MIFARDKSQMCNNLMQFAHVYAWGREEGRHVLSMRFSYKYPFFKIRHTRHCSFALYLLAKYAAALRLIPTASFKYKDCDHVALEQQMRRHRHIVVAGWNVRFYELFLKYRAEICDLFTIDAAITDPVRQQMADSVGALRLGIHIRRGDYDKWQDGRYYFDDQVYANYINTFASLHPEAPAIHVYLSSNDPTVQAETFQRLCPTVTIHNLQGSAPADLFMLSECDYLIGPRSSFSLVASMYRDVPLFHIEDRNPQTLIHQGFSSFDRLFRVIN